jgi:hypothetical protein
VHNNSGELGSSDQRSTATTAHPSASSASAVPALLIARGTGDESDLGHQTERLGSPDRHRLDQVIRSDVQQSPSLRRGGLAGIT